MAYVKHAAEESSPEAFLWSALRAPDAQSRLRFVEDGLSNEVIEPDTHVLLLRQAYLAHVELRQLRHAADTADAMAQIGPMRDIAYHDKSRALQALGDMPAAIDAQRLAARNAPTGRRSFQLWSLATLQHFAGRTAAALESLRRGLRYAKRDRPLLRAHEALIRVEAGDVPESLQQIRDDLAKAKCGEGYGRYVQGMLAFHLGDHSGASPHLKAFLRRNAQLDTAKELTLREELRRARLALASFESH